MNHETTALTLPPRMRATSAAIDGRIAGLIRECWRLELRTRYCCEGGERGTDRQEQYGLRSLAYISFVSELEVRLFYALAGPANWTKKQHDMRRKQVPDWAHDRMHWLLVGGLRGVVRFPSSDIERAEAALRRTNWRLSDLIGDARIGADNEQEDPLPSAPVRLCPSCGYPMPASMRRDARFCSRACQLRGRRRSVRSQGKRSER